MMKISLITTLATLLLLFNSFSIATGEQPSQIIVYKAKKIPKILILPGRRNGMSLNYTG